MKCQKQIPLLIFDHDNIYIPRPVAVTIGSFQLQSQSNRISESQARLIAHDHDHFFNQSKLKQRHVQFKTFTHDEKCSYTVFAILWILYCWTVYLYTKLYFSTFTSYYIFLLISTTVFKLIFKRIGRRIDIIRMNGYAGYALSFVNYLSFEILMECMINLLYVNNYVNFFIMELAVIDDVRLYIRITTIHLCSEMFQSAIRFSKFYFYVTTQLNELTQTYNQTCGGCVGLFTKLINFVGCFKDESTFDQWRIRYSIDMSIRVLCVIVTNGILASYLIIIGCDHYGFKNQHQCYRAVVYYSITFAIDMTYFFIVFVVNYYFAQFNVWKPFLALYHEQKYVVLAIFVMAEISLLLV